jgi:hypothetical protein
MRLEEEIEEVWQSNLRLFTLDFTRLIDAFSKRGENKITFLS